MRLEIAGQYKEEPVVVELMKCVDDVELVATKGEISGVIRTIYSDGKILRLAYINPCFGFQLDKLGQVVEII